MAKSLLEELPKIVNRGKREAQKVLDGLSRSNRVTLQTNELVLPSKDSKDLYRGRIRDIELHTHTHTPLFNKLIYGDNLLAMQALLAGDSQTPSMRGKIDLIYIDPPFDSKADYRTKIHLPGVDIEQRPTVIEQFAYSDTWMNGTASYLEMMVPRLILMRELLSEQGSIYVHIDWHVGHYLKVIMDEIFGKDNFVNEIVWSYGKMASSSKKFLANHDVIFFYRKSADNYFIPIKTKLDKPVKRLAREMVDGRLKNARNPDGTVKYVELTEKLVDDNWGDIARVMPASREYTSFTTQKPEKLVKRMIESSCPPNGIVADFFAGCGTTGAIAEKTGRKWIMCELGKPACMITRKRLIDQDAEPFLYQSIGDYQKEQFEKSSFRRIGELAEVILKLYDAIPFPADSEAPKNVGFKKSGELVYVDSPSRMTGHNTLKKAQGYRNSFMGKEYSKVTVLGWNFVPEIGEIISNLNDPKLNVLVIPPDLLDILKTKAKYKKLVDSGKIKFSSLQYLTIKPVKIEEYDNAHDKITVELENYIILSPEALPLDSKNKQKLEDVIAEDPLTLIEYWSVDPDYDGEVFRSKWQDYRQNVANDNDPFRIVIRAELIIPRENRPRKICVKAVDVFGFESVAVGEVE